MKMTQEEFDNYVDEDAGFCSKCEAVSINLQCCDACGKASVMKLEDALSLEDVEIVEEDHMDLDDDDYDGGSFV